MLDASGLIHVTDNLFLVAEDNQDCLRFFRLDFSDSNDPSFRNTGQSFCLDNGQKQNSDFESMARLGDVFYVIGGYNRKERNRLLSFQLNGWELTTSPLTIPFKPSSFFRRRKRDVEALTSYGTEQLLVGFRKPLDRQGRAQALIVNTNDGGIQSNSPLRFDLQQRGFRDWVQVDANNHLILAGPKRRLGQSSRKIYLWDSNNIEADIRPTKCNIDLGNFRAEGICVRKNEDGLEILISSDESKPAEKLKNNDKITFKLRYIKVSNITDLTQGRHPLLQTVEVDVIP